LLVLLPESFRGGCSFGTGSNGPDSPNKLLSPNQAETVWQAIWGCEPAEGCRDPSGDDKDLDLSRSGTICCFEPSVPAVLRWTFGTVEIFTFQGMLTFTSAVFTMVIDMP
jgi:hypothetical protein